MWNLRPNDRLNDWLGFRISISELPLNEAIDKTVALWSYAPFSKTFLAADLIDDWPSPWELVYDNTYDNLASALGMIYTLYMSDHKDGNTFEIRILRHPGTNEVYHTVWVNGGEYVLNYEYNEVVSSEQLPDELVTDYRYNEVDLKLNQL